MPDVAAVTSAGAASPVVVDFSAGRLPQVRRVVEIIGWLLTALLIFVGVSSIIGRALFLSEAFANPEQDFNPFEIRYYQHYITAYFHLVLGLLIVILGPFQFIRGVRKRYLKLHRWSGRVFIFSGAIGAISGTIIGVFYPFMGLDGQGFNESMATAFFSAIILFSLFMAYYRIRSRAVAAHREWMIRAWALMLAIATERLLLLPLQTFSEADFGVLFGTSFWMAGAINLAAAEFWIHLTRTPGNGARHWKDVDAQNRRL